MEADWEIEIAADAPVIDALWSGFLDLRINPDAVAALEEVQRLSALGNTLLHINGSIPGQSQRRTNLFWTSKCDLWIPEWIDHDEMEASEAESAFALACYIDLIPQDNGLFASLPELESKARQIIPSLRTKPVYCSRIDLILRQAIAGDRHGYGITAYITACGPAHAAVEQTIEAALRALVEAISPIRTS
jgi:hypothetical protein